MQAILSIHEHAALRVLCKRHVRLSERVSTAPNPNVVSALEKLSQPVAENYPMRVTSCGLRRLEVHDKDTRDALIAEFDRLHDEIQRVAERFGVLDPGASTPGELMHELHDATHSPYAPGINETRAVGAA